MLGPGHFPLLPGPLTGQGSSHSTVLYPTSISWSFCLLNAFLKSIKTRGSHNCKAFIFDLKTHLRNNTLIHPSNVKPLIFNWGIKDVISHERNFMQQLNNVQGRGGETLQNHTAFNMVKLLKEEK